MPEKAPSREKARPRVAERVIGRGAEYPQKAAKTTPDGDNMFETQERTIARVDRARIAQKWAKNDHAWHDILRFGEQMLVSQVVFIGPHVFKTKVENDSEITRTSQPTRSRPVECVEVS